METLKQKHYPQWICAECGKKHGNRMAGIATWHPDTCGICGRYVAVTEPRDYGHLKDGWDTGDNDDF